jgi:hypothetical protein
MAPSVTAPGGSAVLVAGVHVVELPIDVVIPAL